MQETYPQLFLRLHVMTKNEHVCLPIQQRDDKVRRIFAWRITTCSFVTPVSKENRRTMEFIPGNSHSNWRSPVHGRAVQFAVLLSLSFMHSFPFVGASFCTCFGKYTMMISASSSSLSSSSSSPPSLKN
jgi:hypothetical protein